MITTLHLNWGHFSGHKLCRLPILRQSFLLLVLKSQVPDQEVVWGQELGVSNILSK